MDIETISENINDLLKRKEIIVKIFSEGKTPTRDNVTSEIAKKYKTKETHIDLKTIHQQTGSQFSVCNINIYTKPIREEKKENTKEEVTHTKEKDNTPKKEKESEEKKENTKEETTPTEEKDNTSKEEKKDDREPKPEKSEEKQTGKDKETGD